MRASQASFAAAMIGLGAVGLAYGDSSLVWADIPRRIPARALVIDACSIALAAAGAMLLVRPLMTVGIRVSCACLLAWLLLLRLPGLLRAPLVTVSWQSFAEIAVPLAGAWCLLAIHASALRARNPRLVAGANGVRGARWLFIAALPMIGLSHFAYAAMTASLVPKWMGFATGWTYATGAASIATSAALLFRIWPRLAASLEAAMLWLITLLVWLPRIASAPGEQEGWSELAVSCAIAAGAWIVADTYRALGWFETETRSAIALPSRDRS